MLDLSRLALDPDGHEYQDTYGTASVRAGSLYRRISAVGPHKLGPNQRGAPARHGRFLVLGRVSNRLVCRTRQESD
jgi:hypothetical protein